MTQPARAPYFTKYDLPIPTREPDGEFACFQTWVNKATSWIGGQNPLCVDAKDRICRNGGDFMRARDEGAFPVRFWFGEGGMDADELAKSKRQHRAAMKLHYPWRFA